MSALLDFELCFILFFGHKLLITTFAVESFGRLGVEGSYFIDQLETSVVGGRDGGSMTRKGVC